MATRKETDEKRRKMREAIINSCNSGQLQAGELLPTVRDLARQYELSINLASEIIQSLVAEGVLKSRPGFGTTVGQPRRVSAGEYLFLLPENVSYEYAAAGHIGIVQRGFEIAIAQLGGISMVLETGQARRYALDGQLPELAGLFGMYYESVIEFPNWESVPSACFGEPIFPEESKIATKMDSIHFDDFNGGQQATRHLLNAGYESIAFLAMHSLQASNDFIWSTERERGWRQAMNDAGKSCDNLTFHPPYTTSVRERCGHEAVHGDRQVEAAIEAVKTMLPLIQQRTITGVVAANLFAAKALFEGLQQANVESKLWPAVVCFDSLDGLDPHVISALNLSWEDVGKAAAQLLWERNIGKLRGASIVRTVPMQLIPRLTSRPDWTIASPLVMPYFEKTLIASCVG